MTASGTERGGAFSDARASFFAAARRDRIDLLPPGRGAVVLELGCGSGATGALALREGRCASWIGVEPNAAAATEALYALTEVHVGDIETLDLPYDTGTFDVVFVGDRLPFFSRPKATLAKLVKLLKPGGWLFAASEGEPLPPRLAPKRAGKLFRRVGLRAIRIWAASDGRRRGLFERRRYIRLEARGRKW